VLQHNYAHCNPYRVGQVHTVLRDVLHFQQLHAHPCTNNLIVPFMQQNKLSRFHVGGCPLSNPSGFRLIQCLAFLRPLVFASRSALSAAGCSISSCGFVPASAPTSCPGFPIVLVQAIRRVVWLVTVRHDVRGHLCLCQSKSVLPRDRCVRILGPCAFPPLARVSIHIS